MVIGGLLFGMMSQQEPCTGAASPEEIVLRRRSKDWILPSTSVTNGLANGGRLCGDVSSQSIAATLSSMTAAAASNAGSPAQFRKLIEMLLYCYLEYGGTQRSEQFRNLVEVFLYPVFEPVNRPACNNSSALPVMSASTTPTTGITSVVTPAPSITQNDAQNNTLTSSESVSGASVSETHVAVKDNTSATKGANGFVNVSLLCPSCFGVLIDPVTIQCGHSYCKKCLQKEVAGQSCRRCNHNVKFSEAAQCKTNVLLGALVEKWWPDYVTATRLRNEGNDLYEAKQVSNAIFKYDQALALVPDDHLSLANRSNCLLTAGRSEEALQDAEAAIKQCPQWPKGHFRKSCAMTSLGRYEEAFLSLTVCMYLMKLSSPPHRRTSSSCSGTSSAPSSSSSSAEDPGRALVINKMIKILQKLFLQSTSAVVGSTLKRHSMNAEHNGIQFTPYPGARRRSSGAAFNRQDWNDCNSEYNSSGDESDHVIQAHHQNGWKSCRGNVRQLQRSSATASVVEQLSMRMSRLFSRAAQDLKSFESRLRVAGSQGMKTLPRIKAPTAVTSSDLECSLCYRLLFQPVSTECGHTFCRSCLDRCMDHNPACPLCKTGLQSYLACREHALTEYLEAAIKSFLPKEHAERLNQHMEELNSVAHAEGKNPDVDIPIFVCTMAFPTIPCPLHVFEPRYRLMIRRCMENGSNKFGMCCYLADGENNYGDIGTLLEIRNIQYFADGRSVVDTVGCRRFKVLNKNVVDGYNAARIELLQDKPVVASDVEAVKELHDKVFKEANDWLNSIGQVRRQRIHSHFGQMPVPEDDWIGSPDGPSWTWWLLAILPLDSKAQLAILSMCSLQRRLECILKVLNFVKHRMGSIGE